MRFIEYIKDIICQVSDSPNCQINLDRSLSQELDLENFSSQFKELHGQAIRYSYAPTRTKKIT